MFGEVAHIVFAVLFIARSASAIGLRSSTAIATHAAEEVSNEHNYMSTLVVVEFSEGRFFATLVQH